MDPSALSSACTASTNFKYSPPRLWVQVMRALLGVVLVALLVPLRHDARAEAAGEPQNIRYVIHISVDGLRPDAVTRHGERALPNFYRLRTEGAYTDNARTDVDYGNTLPNHIAQLTGRPVLGPSGHGWNTNRYDDASETLHTRRGAYLPSVFDVVHDAGLRTGVFASKEKFALLERSYNAAHGAPDKTGADHGRKKIDTYVYEKDTKTLVRRFVRETSNAPFEYAFVHLRDPDSRGHAWGWRLWKWHPYMRAVRHADRLLGEIFSLIENDPRMANRTAIILTADHGGSGHDHGADARTHYTVPFYVWGPGISAGDLYDLGAGSVADPGLTQPAFGASRPPVRNGSAANLALALLGLEPIPGSTIPPLHGIQTLFAQE